MLNLQLRRNSKAGAKREFVSVANKASVARPGFFFSIAQTPAKIDNLTMRKLIILIVIALAAIASYFIFGKNQANSPSVPVQSQILFVNQDWKYSFEYPPVWKAAINEYNKNNSLFGPDASSTEGLGGVEIFPDQKSIDTFLSGVAAQYSEKTNITINGVAGIRMRYQSFPISGEQVSILKDGKIYNIYIGNDKSEDVDIFNQIVSSFKFIK
ncbi:MAG: hypothetical protein NTW60_01750 [Candidatus Wolfebacteria bacterium]|nr:hypothetical protein [Candidatus Wolfebacteria bacterium]